MGNEFFIFLRSDFNGRKSCIYWCGINGRSRNCWYNKYRFLNSEQIYVTNKDNQSRLQEMKDTYQVVTDSNKKETIKDANVVVFGTKPYYLEEAFIDTN